MAQNSIIELQVINHVVKTKNLKLLRDENITPEQFSDVYKDVITYIFDHEEQYHVVPDETTLLSKFGEDYTVLEVNESPTYLITKLKGFLAYVQVAKAFSAAKPQIESGDMEKALPFLLDSVESAMKIYGQSKAGTDITKDHERLEAYETRLNSDHETTYSLGLKTLDEEFGGLLRDDIFLLFARVNHGKSQLMTYFAHALHKQGLKVLFYSGEMDATQVGYRYDCIDSHFSNRELLFGRQLSGTTSIDQYKDYLKGLAEMPNYFRIVEPVDLGGRFINMNDIRKLVDEWEPDVVFIDQLSLVEDIKSTKTTQERIRYGNIMADLRVLANTKRIPIVVAAQANRQATEKDDEGEFKIPEMSHVAESDAIAHHATRAIAFCTNRNIDTGEVQMKVAIRKNRHGAQTEFKMNVDFDKGQFEEIRQKTLRADTLDGAAKF